MNINEIKKFPTKFNLEKVKKIINQIESTLNKNIGPIVKLINEDNKEFAENLTYSKLTKFIEKIKNETWEIQKNSKYLKIDGLGNIAVIYNGSPEILLYLSLKALKTHNNIVFFENTNIHKASIYIIDLINSILIQNSYTATINIKRAQNFNEIYEYEKNFDKYICIGEIQKFNLLKNNIKKNIIYSAYGTLSLYLDDKNLKDTLLQMDEFIYTNNLNLNLYKDKNVEDVVNKINEKGEDFCSVIFTKDVKKAYYFCENVNSHKIYINKNPFVNYDFYIDDKNLLKQKEIFM